jgi:hypothetical protein
MTEGRCKKKLYVLNFIHVLTRLFLESCIEKQKLIVKEAIRCCDREMTPRAGSRAQMVEHPLTRLRS